jgi:hypothetical protein
MPKFGFLLLALLMPSCSTPQPDIYLLPLGHFSSAVVSELADHYKQRFNLRVTVLAATELEDRVIDNNILVILRTTILRVFCTVRFSALKSSMLSEKTSRVFLE